MRWIAASLTQMRPGCRAVLGVLPGLLSSPNSEKFSVLARLWPERLLIGVCGPVPRRREQGGRQPAHPPSRGVRSRGAAPRTGVPAVVSLTNRR